MRVADMYYQQEMLQDEIAKKLNVSRTTVSRALTKAKKRRLHQNYNGFSVRKCN